MYELCVFFTGVCVWHRPFVLNYSLFISISRLGILNLIIPSFVSFSKRRVYSNFWCNYYLTESIEYIYVETHIIRIMFNITTLGLFLEGEGG